MINELQNINKSHGFYFWIILSIFAVTLLAYSIIYPLNGATPDSWSHFYYPHIGQWNPIGQDRPFVFTVAMIIESLYPGSAPSRVIGQMLVNALTSILLVRLIVLFASRQRLFALTFGIVFILYIPSNPDQARYFFSLYPWSMLLKVSSVVFLYEGVLSKKGRFAWLYILVGGITGFMAIRTVESAIPLLAIAPSLLIFLPHARNRQTLLRMFIWSIFIVGATVYFFSVTFTSGDEYISTLKPSEPLSIPKMWQSLLFFLQLSFPIERLTNISSNYIFPGILLAIGTVASIVLVFRRFSLFQMPSYLTLMTLGGVGFCFTVLGSAAWVYIGMGSDFYYHRLLFPAAPGQALVINTVIWLFVKLFADLIRVPAIISLSFLMGIYGLMGAQWYYDAQVYAGEEVSAQTRYFQDSLEMFRDVIGLAPNVKDDVLMILFCDRNTPYRPHNWSDRTAFAGIYFYDTVHIEHVDNITFLPDKVERTNKAFQTKLQFTYDRIIGLECQDNALYILNRLPEELLPPFVDPTIYNPYSLITGGFIPSERSRILRWGTVRTPNWLMR